VIEAALLEQAARCETLSSEDRAALENELADLARRYLARAQELAKLAQKVHPPGWNPFPGR
jgi:prefoldin subunit 5